MNFSESRNYLVSQLFCLRVDNITANNDNNHYEGSNAIPNAVTKIPLARITIIPPNLPTSYDDAPNPRVYDEGQQLPRALRAVSSLQTPAEDSHHPLA